MNLSEDKKPVGAAGVATNGIGSTVHRSGDFNATTVYRVRDWDSIYENNRSRTVKELQWVPIPNRFDGEGYTLVMSNPDAAKIFTAFVLILEVASRCNPRGTLVKADGRPHTPESLALKTRGQREWFELSFPFLSSPEIRWLEVVKYTNATPHSQQPDTTLTPACQSPVSQVTIEGMEWNGKKGSESPLKKISTADRISLERELTEVTHDLRELGRLAYHDKGSKKYNEFLELNTRRTELRNLLGVLR